MAGSAIGFGLAALAKGIGGGMVASEEERQRLALEQMRQQAQADRSTDANATRLAIAEMRGQLAGGGGGKKGLSLAEIEALASDPERAKRLMALGGMTGEDAADAVAIQGGNTPGGDVELSPSRFVDPSKYGDNAGVETTVKQSKYTSGQASELARRGAQSLRRALGLMDVGAADDIAKAENTEQNTSMVSRYAAGNDRAGDAALIGQGKDPAIGEARQTAADAAMKKASGGGGAAGAAGRVRVQSTRVDSAGNIIAIMSDGTTKTLGQGKEYQAIIQAEKKALSKTIEGSSLSDKQLEAKAVENIMSRSRTSSAEPAAPAASKPASAAGSGAPPASLLKEGVQTKFKNGQVWTLRNGQPVRVS